MLEGLTITSLTAPAILGLAVLMLFTGKIWTNPAHQEVVKEAQRWREAYLEKIEEAKHWHTAYQNEAAARSTSDAQTAELLEVAKTTQAFITAVFQNSERIRQLGEPDVAPKK